MNRLLAEFQGQADKVIKLAEDDLKGVKTGRAKPSLVEDVKVQAYGGAMTLRELASISAPDPQQIVVSPWDKQLLTPIEKALGLTDLNLSPVVDGDLVRIKIPPLTAETRENLIKLVHQKLESARALLRRERNDYKTKIETQKDQPGISEDDIHQQLAELQEITDKTMTKLDSLGEAKEAELRDITGG